MNRPLLLVVLDGWGLQSDRQGNAIAQAHTPFMDACWQHHPHTTLLTSGSAVGLPTGQMGNSEVGHMTIGAGRVVVQDLTRIRQAIETGTFANVFQRIFAEIGSQQAVHLCGLLSDGGVHSHLDIFSSLVQAAKQAGAPVVWIHAFLDGRDVSPTSAPLFLQPFLQDSLATVIGRFYAMDRDQRWPRTEKAYRALVDGEGERCSQTQLLPRLAALQSAGITDEFVPPLLLTDEQGQPRPRIQAGDTVIFCNFRPDRMRQLTCALLQPTFTGFPRSPQHPYHLHGVTLTRYEKSLPCTVAFPPHEVEQPLGQVIAEAHLPQLRIAETEKYPHVTWFFNGGREAPFPLERRILIPSPAVATYDLQPAMSAEAITDALLAELGQFVWGLVNFANPDMVGHSGQLAATVEAVEAVDACLGRIVEAVWEQEGTVLVTADHGNAEQMVDAEGNPHTAHTTSPVPLLLLRPQPLRESLHEGGSLADIAPTILDLLGLPIPAVMTGRSLWNKEGG